MYYLGIKTVNGLPYRLANHVKEKAQFKAVLQKILKKTLLLL